MLPLATVAAIAWAVWRGAHPLGIALMVAGLLVQVAAILRLARASAGGVGGHAEWVRERSLRARLLASPAWLTGMLLVVAGLVLGLWR
jgi:hypothetical protein